MKKAIFITMFAVVALVAKAQMQEAKINFEVETHDFGEIKEADGPVTFVFKFNNIGNTPLILKNVRASCGCTTPSYTKEPIAPNAKGEIQVTYNPANRPGSFRKTITVTSNSTPENVYLAIAGKVVARQKSVEEIYPFMLGALRAKKIHISFFNLTNTQVKSYGVEVINTTPNKITVTIPDLPAHVSCPTLEINPGEEKVINFAYDAAKKQDWGFVTDDISLWIDGVKVSINLRLSATITEDFSALTSEQRANAPRAVLSARKADFGVVNRGENVVQTFTITNTGKRPLIIHSVKSTSALVDCKVSAEELPVGAKATVEVTMGTRNTKGRQYKTINVITNDPATPNLTYTLSGSVN